MKIKNKRGAELAIGTIVTIIIVLIVLIVIATWFLGGFDQIGSSISNIGNSTAGESTGVIDALRRSTSSGQVYLCCKKVVGNTASYTTKKNECPPDFPTVANDFYMSSGYLTCGYLCTNANDAESCCRDYCSTPIKGGYVRVSGGKCYCRS
ncbi:MAG: hypothetical protein ABIG20_02125 [archaeon]